MTMNATAVRRALVLFVLVTCPAAWAQAGTIRVPEDQPTIQAAVAAAAAGTVIDVAPGTYSLPPGGAGYAILLDKDVTLRSRNLLQAVLDGGGQGILIQVRAAATIEGFVLQNAWKGIQQRSSPDVTWTARNLVVRNVPTGTAFEINDSFSQIGTGVVSNVVVDGADNAFNTNDARGFTVRNVVVLNSRVAFEGYDHAFFDVSYSILYNVQVRDHVNAAPAVNFGPGLVEGVDPLLSDVRTTGHLFPYVPSCPSVAVDAGDPAAGYADASIPPAWGTTRNDAGAYGGPAGAETLTPGEAAEMRQQTGCGLVVTSPAGGTFSRGGVLPVAWAGSGISFDLALWKGEGPYHALASGVPGTSHDAALPAWLPLGTDYRVRVNAHAEPLAYGFSGTFAVVDPVPEAGSLRGTVTSASSGSAIGGAAVKCGLAEVAAQPDGRYALDGLAPGSYACSVSAPGFVAGGADVTIPSGGAVLRDFALQPTSAVEAPRVLSVTHGWRDFLYLLPATATPLTLKATVDWAGHAPESVTFSVGGSETTVPTNSDVATAHFDAADMAGCSEVVVWARAADGASSEPVRGPFATMTSPTSLGELFAVLPGAETPRYRARAGFDLKVFNEVIEGGVIPDDIPGFGGRTFHLRFVPTVTSEVTGAGRYTLALDPNGAHKTFFKVAGAEFRLAPRVSVSGQYAPCGWSWSGELGGNVRDKSEAKWHFVLPGPTPLPVHWALGVEASVDFGLGVKDLKPFTGEGFADPKATIKGSLGLGANRATSVEGWVSGTLDASLQMPTTPTLRSVGILVDAGVAVDSRDWTWEDQRLHWEWSQEGSASAYAPPRREPIQPRLIGRDDRKLERQVALGPAQIFASRAGAGGTPTNVVVSAVEPSTLPHPEPSLSSAGSYVYGAWLVDDPARTTVNRNKAVLSSFDGTSWGAASAVADDGTSDFAPQVRAFADGRAWVVWEDAHAALASDAVFEDTVKSLEVSAALFDPALPGFRPAHRLTSNEYLDATPRLSGPSADDVLAVWVANPANALLGTAAEPNTVQASWWNGTAWSAAETVAQVGYPILRSELLYDGTSAFVVMGVDTDDDTETDADVELALLRFTAGAWHPLEWLTSNGVVDANPRLVTGPGGTGTRLAWMQGDALKVADDFDVAHPSHTLAVAYSTNLADFRLARSDDGRMAVVWTEPSEFSSDIRGVFFDPATATWGAPQQLTADAATEKETAPLLYGGSLLSLYARRELITANRVPQAGPTDLVMVRTILGEDVALVGGSFAVDPPNPAPGVPVTLGATATNLGELPLEGSAVAFYHGDPAAGGVEVGRATVAGPVATGGQAAVSVEWTVPATTVPVAVYAVVDPDATSADRDRTNNVQRLTLALPDLQVSGAGAAPLGETTVSVVARVTNNGSTPTPASDFKFRLDSATGAVLHQETVPALAVGQSVDVGFVLGTAGLANGSVIVALSDEANAVAEHDETNNASSLSVSLQPPSVDLGVTLQGAPDPAAVGADLVYTAVVANAGPDTANGVTLTMPVPTGASLVSALATQGACDESAGTIGCGLGALASAGQAIVTVTVRPGAVGTLGATASVGATEADTDPADDTATTSTTVLVTRAGFYTVTPCRVVDSRSPAGAFGGQPLQAKVERTLVVTEACGIPPTAKAVSLNLTVTEATADGHVRLYAGGTPAPLISTLNFRPGQTRANNAIAALGSAGDLALYAGMASGSVHVIVDVNGFLEE